MSEEFVICEHFLECNDVSCGHIKKHLRDLPYFHTHIAVDELPPCKIGFCSIRAALGFSSFTAECHPIKETEIPNKRLIELEEEE